MKRIALFLLAVLMMTGVAGCGGGDDDGGPTGSTATTDVTGSWTGTGTITGTGTYSTWFNLSQSGTSVTGTWEDYPVSGSIDGDTLHLTLTPFTESGINYTGNIEGAVKGDSMSGTMNISGTQGSVVITLNGSFTVTRTRKSVGRGAAGGVSGRFFAP